MWYLGVCTMVLNLRSPIFFSAFRCTLVLRHHQKGRKLFVTFQRSSVNIILPRVCPRFMKMYALEKSWISYEKFKETLY